MALFADFEVGDQVMYCSANEAVEIAEVIGVHLDDLPPYYSIRYVRNGFEKQTTRNHLTLLPDGDDEVEEPAPAPSILPASSSLKNDTSSHAEKCSTPIMRSITLRRLLVPLSALFACGSLSIGANSLIGFLISFCPLVGIYRLENYIKK